MKTIICILLLLLSALTLVFLSPQTLGLTFLERNIPQVQISTSGAGVESGSISIKASDSDSAIQSIVVSAEQDGKTTELLNKQFEQAKKIEELNVSYLKLNEGTAKIKATVSDTSFWSNKADSEADVLIDFSPPRVKLLSLQHVAAQGGTEFVIYHAEDSNLSSHGVSVGADFFPGFKIEDAKNEDIAAPKTSQAHTYISLFALPLGYAKEGPPAQITVKDTAGNVVNIPLHFRLETLKQAEVVMNLKDDFLNSKTPDLFPGYLKMASAEQRENNKFAGDIPETLWKFRLINRNYRDMLDAELHKLLNNSSRPRQWKETFIKPMSSATSSTFGEKRTYKYNDLDGGYSVHNGLDLASVNNDKVHAANDGVVILSKDFGIYGNTVVIDHGLGLFSLYGHLSSIGVKIDDKVTRGQEIGRSGQTGLAGGDHLHFEFRLRHVPVNPIEWWDSKWIKDNIDGKIQDL